MHTVSTERPHAHNHKSGSGLNNQTQLHSQRNESNYEENREIRNYGHRNTNSYDNNSYRDNNRHQSLSQPISHNNQHYYDEQPHQSSGDNHYSPRREHHYEPRGHDVQPQTTESRNSVFLEEQVKGLHEKITLIQDQQTTLIQSLITMQKHIESRNQRPEVYPGPQTIQPQRQEVFQIPQHNTLFPPNQPVPQMAT